MGHPKLSGGTPDTSWSVLDRISFQLAPSHRTVNVEYCILNDCSALSNEEDVHLHTAAFSSPHEECFHDPSVESMKTQAAPSPECLLIVVMIIMLIVVMIIMLIVVMIIMLIVEC